MTELERVEIAKLALAPGDVLVVRLKRSVPMETMARVNEYFRASVPDGVKLLVIDGDVELSVLTRAEIEARS